MRQNMALCMLAVFASLLLVFSACKTEPKEESATITGKITSHGTIMEENGQEYLLAGDKAVEFAQNVGKKFELRGAVLEEGERRTITVEEYRMIDAPIELVPASRETLPAEEPLAEEPLAEEPIKMLLQEEETL